MFQNIQERHSFIIYAPSYVTNSGGIVVLYLLCNILQEMGFSASIWPDSRIIARDYSILRPRRLVSNITGSCLRNFNTGPWHPNIASPASIKNAIVIYPEIVNGNPLNASRVVRWLLNQEGFFVRSSPFDKKDLVFYYNSAFLNGILYPFVGGELNISYIPSEYHVEEAPLSANSRQDNCYIRRKSCNQQDIHPSDAINLDGLPHPEVSEIMRRSRYYYSYDPYTMYSYFASLSGCIPIVVPIDGLSEEDWQPDVQLRYGLAYGRDRINWAEQTRHLLIERINKIQQFNIEAIRRFVDICTQYFS